MMAVNCSTEIQNITKTLEVLEFLYSINLLEL